MSESRSLTGANARSRLPQNTTLLKIRFGLHVRFAPKATELLCRKEMQRWAMCGRLRVGKDFLRCSSIGRCGHVFGLLARLT
jgi:hypothetical protein